MAQVTLLITSTPDEKLNVKAPTSDSNNEDIIMSTYNKKFELSIKDIDLIERSLRFQISQLAHTETSSQTKESVENHNKIIELMSVLSTFHNQKIWYSQTHHTRVPLG